MTMNYWTGFSKRRWQRRTILAGATATGAAAFAGCGDDEPAPSPSSGSPAGGGSTGATAVATKATPVDLSTLSEEEFFKALPENPPKDWTDNDIKAGGRLNRMITAGSVSTFDPPTSNSDVNAEYYQAVYSKLIRFSARQGMKSVALPEIEGDLAASWERPDLSTLVFKLLPGIKWQNKAPVNGRTFTTEDIAYSINRVKTFAGSLHKSRFALFESVTALPDGRVQIKLSKPSLSAEEILCQFYGSVVPRELGENPDAAKTTAVGTGSMSIKSNTPNVEVVFEKNPDFFKSDARGRRLPYLDGYNLVFFRDRDGAAAAFETKQIDFHFTTTSPTDFDGLFSFYKRHKDIIAQKFAPAAVGFTLTPHADRAPWNDLRVRRALTQAIPYEKVIKGLFKGNGIITPFFPWPYAVDKKPTVADLGPTYKYDPKEAKALLSAAGFPNGLDLELAMYTTTEQVSVAIQQEILESGFRAKLAKDPDLATISVRRTTKNWKDLITFGRVLPFVNPSATWGVYIKGDTQNYSGFEDPKFEELWSAFNKATLLDDQKQIGKQMWAEILAKVPDAPMPSADRLWITQPTVRNMVDTTWLAQAGNGLGQMEAVWRNG